MTPRTLALASDQGVVQLIGGRDRRSCGILAGRFEADGLWILPEAWKTLSRRRDQTDASGPAFSTPPWTARAPPTGTTGILTLVTNKATRIGSTRRRHTELTRN